MKNTNFKYNILLFSCMAALTFVPFDTVRAQSYSADSANYYQLGMSAFDKRDYTKSIEYLKKALQNEPENTSIRNNLAVALTSRATYYFNKNIDLEKAANDYRAAIYYLQYYDKSKNSATIDENIGIATQNLINVLAEQKVKTDAQSRLKKAKELRGKGELEASVIEYINAAKDNRYAYESYVALGDVLKVLTNEYNAAVYYDKALSKNSSDANLHLKFARTLYNLGNIDTAVRELDIASQNSSTKNDALNLLERIWKDRVMRTPKNPVAQMNLGVVYQNKGNYEQAMAQYKTAQTLDPKNLMIKINIGTLYQEQKNYSQALEIYNAVLKTRPNDFTVASYKAETLAQMGKTDEAVVTYKDILAKNPNNDVVKKSLLNSLMRMNSSSSEHYFSDLASQYPNDAEIQYAYAYVLHKNSKMSQALNYYQKALALNTNNVDAYLNIANIYKYNGNTEDAISILNRAKSVFPNNQKVSQMLSEYTEEQNFSLVEKATALYNNKNYEGAIKVYQQIKNPTEDVYLGIGACYQAMEKYSEAISYYKKAVALDNSNPTSYYFLGLAYLYQKDFPNAKSALQKAAALDPINPDIADANKTLKYDVSEAEMNRGVTLLEENKVDEAIIKFNNAIINCPENGYAYYYRGLAFDTKNEHQKAISDFKKSVSVSPELIMAYYSMGLAYDAMNNKVEAKNMYQKYVNLSETNDEYQKYAKQRLSEL